MLGTVVIKGVTLLSREFNVLRKQFFIIRVTGTLCGMRVHIQQCLGSAQDQYSRGVVEAGKTSLIVKS